MIKMFRAAAAVLVVLAALVFGDRANAVPSICVMPTSGTVSGLTLVQDINSCLGSALSLFSGGSAPGAPTTGMLWWNTSTGVVAMYDGSNWNPLWTVDSTNHLNAMQIGGGVPGTLASATVTDLWSVSVSSVSVTGTTSITQLANADAVPGSIKIVTFAGILTLTQGTPIGLPNNGSNITTAAGDYAIVLALTSTNVQVIQYTRATGAALSTQGLNIGASALAQSAQGYGSPLNLQLAAAVSGNNLTVTVLGVNGSNPSSSNPVLVNFRSQTLNNGSNGVVYGQITSALSFTALGGVNMGCTTAVLCRLWVELICQTESSGACTSILVGLSDQSTSGEVYPLSEDALQSTGVTGSCGCTVGLIQTSVASLSGKAIRIAGYVEVTWTNGVGWATTPSKVQLFGPGVKKPGDTVQEVFFQTASGTSISGTAAASAVTASVTPTSAVNIVEISASALVNCAASNGQVIVTANLRRGASTNIGEAFQLGQSVSGTITGASIGPNGALSWDIIDAPATTSSTAYTVYGNSSTGTSTLGGGHIRLREIMGALDLDEMLPANDNTTPLRLVG